MARLQVHEGGRDARSRMVRAWEELGDQEMAVRLNRDRGGDYSISVTGAPVQAMQKICEAHGLKATVGPYGVTITLDEEAGQ